MFAPRFAVDGEPRPSARHRTWFGQSRIDTTGRVNNRDPATVSDRFQPDVPDISGGGTNLYKS